MPQRVSHFSSRCVVYHISEQGWKHVSAQDNNDLYHEQYGLEAKEKAAKAEKMKE
jgi:hypothetical protein